VTGLERQWPRRKRSTLRHKDIHMRRDGSVAKPLDGSVRVPSGPAPRFLANIRADRRSHAGDWQTLGFWALVVYRFGRWRYGVRPVLLRKALSAAYKLMFRLVQIVTGIELPCEVTIGRNFVIDHHGGIVISGGTRFGDDCRIRNGVCIGVSHVGDARVPVIGNGVDIGTGAKLLGPITIGDNVLIGANAVVLCDVPSDSIAVGVPARVKPRKGRVVLMKARPVERPLRAVPHRRLHRAGVQASTEAAAASAAFEANPAPGLTEGESVAPQLAVK
jgi:serine O-acetyltransferase